MEVISITEEQREKLCKELARLVFEFREDKNIGCIYFAPYRCLNNIDGNVLSFTLVVGANSENDNLDERIMRYNSIYEEPEFVKKIGIKIHINTDDMRKYTTDKTSFGRLFNSTILFDRTGEWTRRKEETSVDKMPNENLAEIVPPLMDTLDRYMDINRMERDTKAVRRFTKSELFEQLKNVK